MQRNLLCSIGSRSLHCSKTARLGIWEDDKFIGAIVFAWHSLLVSYADVNLRHGGKIYQASNWLFVGETGYGHHSERQIDPPQNHLEVRHERYGLAAETD